MSDSRYLDEAEGKILALRREADEIERLLNLARQARS